jgi:hypothetical protein
MGHPAFCKKQAEKNRVILYSKREETRLPLFFLNYNDLGFLHSVFFKKQGAQFLSGCRLTGRVSPLSIFSIYQPLFLNKPSPFIQIPNPEYLFGMGI